MVVICCYVGSKVNIKGAIMQGKKFDVKLFYPLIIRQLQNGIFQKFDGGAKWR